jgi:membrane protease YdiL (CAAX protease family)
MMPPTPPAPPRPDLDTIPASEGAGAHQVPWRWWHAMGIFAVGFLVIGTIAAIGILLVMGGELTQGTGIGSTGIVASAVADVAFGGVMLLWLRSRTHRWREAIRLTIAGSRFRAFAAGLGMGLILYPVVALGVGTLLVIVFRLLTGETITVPDQLSPELSVGGQILAGVLTVGVAPVVEELFFRGILFRSLRRHGFWAAAILSSILFGVVHYVGGPALSAVLLMIATASTGFGLALIYEWRGLPASIGAHVAFNAIGVVIIFSVG